MKTDFDQTVNRIGTDAIKWNLDQPDVIPLWVADMDFLAPEAVKNALVSRAMEGVYGYPYLQDEYYQAEIHWWKKRHQYEIKKEWIHEVTGVIPALSSVVEALTKPDDQVIIQTPVYQHFNTSIANNNRTIVKNHLLYQNGQYQIDFDHFETLAKDERTTLFILCNPHNPVGRCFTREELSRMNQICLENNVIILSDEIHRDLVYPGEKYTPILDVADDINHIVTVTAPTKTFNLAGLRIANIIVPNPEYKKRINRVINIKEVGEPNVFGIAGLIAAYLHGEEWLDQLLDYLNHSKEMVTSFFVKHLPKAKVIRPEGTYLMWIDLSEYDLDFTHLERNLIDKGKVRVNGGHRFEKGLEQFIRINIATNRKTLQEGLNRIVNTISSEIEARE